MLQKNFLLGVGLNRTGSSWLYEQIKKSPNFNKGLCKEYHVFDTVDIPECRGYEFTIDDLIKKRSKFRVGNFKLLKSFFSNTDKYFDYQNSLFKTDSKHQTQLACDITLNYYMLSQNRLYEIKKQLLQRDITPKVIFTIREPISKLIGSAKVLLKFDTSIIPIDEQSYYNTMYYTTNFVESHNIIQKINEIVEDKFENYDYHEILNKFQTVFDSNEFMFAFYENFFSSESIKKISDFLTVGAEHFDSSQVINQIQVEHFKMPVDFILKLYHHFADYYSYIYKHYPHIKPLWQNTIMNLTKLPPNEFNQIFNKY